MQVSHVKEQCGTVLLTILKVLFLSLTNKIMIQVKQNHIEQSRTIPNSQSIRST